DCSRGAEKPQRSGEERVSAALRLRLGRPSDSSYLVPPTPDPPPPTRATATIFRLSLPPFSVTALPQFLRRVEQLRRFDVAGCPIERLEHGDFAGGGAAVLEAPGGGEDAAFERADSVVVGLDGAVEAAAQVGEVAGHDGD